MEESNFVNEFYDVCKKTLSKKFIVERKSNLLYELFLNRNLEISIIDTQNPKRGFSAFQTDICIYEKIKDIYFPRIVIEFKTQITTHDILTYSSKAGKHKQIYPVLRYGILASDIEFIPNRFFIHNEHLDFFIAAKGYHGKKLNSLISKLILDEIKISKKLERIHFANHKYNYYRNDIKFKNF